MKLPFDPTILYLYNQCKFNISFVKIEPESNAYSACNFTLNGRPIIGRTAKETPKKHGQFVTFWKRNANGKTTPFDKNDRFDFYVVNVKKQQQIGQFVFPKSILIEQGIITVNNKDGKRGFRVYPSWDILQSRQAKRTQQWQLDYFFEVNESTDINRLIELYLRN